VFYSFLFFIDEKKEFYILIFKYYITNKYYMRKKISNITIIQSSSKTSSVYGTIDYKNVLLLRKFITSEGKIVPRRVSGISSKQQRFITKAIKNARMVGLLPFIHKEQ
jgi:small subunit ribosomal protein S18